MESIGTCEVHKTAQMLNQTFWITCKTDPAIGTSSEDILFAIACWCTATKINRYHKVQRGKNVHLHTQMATAAHNSCSPKHSQTNNPKVLRGRYCNKVAIERAELNLHLFVRHIRSKFQSYIYIYYIYISKANTMTSVWDQLGYNFWFMYRYLHSPQTLGTRWQKAPFGKDREYDRSSTTRLL